MAFNLEKAINEAVRESLGAKKAKPKAPATTLKTVAKTLKEALIVLPKSFSLKTEKLSAASKEAHELLYQECVKAFNRLSAQLDSANRSEANDRGSAMRSLKLDECANLNSVKLHELFFGNISDMASEISIGSLPYMRLARDFGTFENWQFDFLACCLSSKDGWALVCYEPLKSVYTNAMLDGDSCNIPIGTIPIIVMDMHEHSYFKDFGTDKHEYIACMMREFNWNIIEARMALAERTQLEALYMIQPVTNAVPEELLSKAAASPPIDNVSAPGEITSAPPTTPAKPMVP